MDGILRCLLGTSMVLEMREGFRSLVYRLKTSHILGAQVTAPKHDPAPTISALHQTSDSGGLPMGVCILKRFSLEESFISKVWTEIAEFVRTPESD